MFKNWTTEDWVKKIPPLISILSILIVSIISFGNMGMISVSFMFALVVGVTPYMIYRYYIVRKVRAIENQFPNFLRDLVEAKKSGMTLPGAISSTSKTEYGKLTPEVRKMANQLSWGISFNKVLKMFSNRVEESDLIGRSMRILIEAQKSGGDVVSTMETLASDAMIIKEAEKERKSRAGRHVFVMYIIFFMFLGIAIALAKILIQIAGMPGTQAAGGFLGGMSGNLCEPYLGQESSFGFICSFFFSICELLNFGGGASCYYKSLFFSMVMIEGIFSGLLIGQIGEDSIPAGFKHSLILGGAGFATFVLISVTGIL